MENLEQPKHKPDADACRTYLETMKFDAASLRNICAYFSVDYPPGHKANTEKLCHWIALVVPWQEIEKAMAVKYPDSLKFG